jgi:hypothetical protein
MTLNQSALLELTDVLRTADGGQVMRLMLSAMLQALVDAEATAHIGANPYEHTPTRTTQRNGTREKTVSTTAGDLMVKIPKLRAGSFFPSLRHHASSSPCRRCSDDSGFGRTRVQIDARSATQAGEVARTGGWDELG